MKIWPIITFGLLLYGSSFSDGRIPPRESNPHPRPHRAAEIELPDRPITKTPSTKIFTPMLALDADGTEWVFQQNQIVEKEVEGDIFDNDPAKQWLLHTIFHYADGPVNRDLSDPDLGDNPAPSAQPYEGNAPTGWKVIYETVDTVAAPEPDHDNAAVDAQTRATAGALPFGGLQALGNLTMSPGGAVTETPCATLLVNGVCPIPCAPDSKLPSCDVKSPPTVITEPLGGLPVGDPPPPITVVLGGGGHGGGVVGNVPEPSTWVMLVMGFVLMALFGWISGSRSRPQRFFSPRPPFGGRPCRNP